MEEINCSPQQSEQEDVNLHCYKGYLGKRGEKLQW